MTYTQAQFDRLPKWAQQVIKNADSKYDYAKRTIEDNERLRVALDRDIALAALDSVDRSDWRGPVVAVRDPYNENPVPVARERDHIRFYLTEGHDHHEWIDFCLRGGVVEITGDRGLLIRSRSGNRVEVYLDER